MRYLVENKLFFPENYFDFSRNNNIFINTELLCFYRSNNFKNDPLSRCDCTPPYSGENAISCRSELNPKNGTYPFAALGFRDHGATDMKVGFYLIYN